MSQLWRKIFSGNSYVPPAKERQDAYKPANAENFPFAVALKGVDLPQIKQGFQYQVRACFYDAKFCLFFGHPWRSRWVAPRRGESKLVFNETIFFHILYNLYKDPSIVLLVEVATRDQSQDLSDDMLEGWTVVRLATRDISDFSDHQTSQINKSTLYSGSPKMLMFVRDPVEQNSRLLKTQGCIHFSLQTHRLLARGYDFIPENTILGNTDLIPGLDQPERGSSLINPVPKAPAPGFLDSLTLQLGTNAETIEAELCALCNKERLFKDNQLPQNGEEMLVLERRIRIGIHNGWSFIQEPVTFHLSSDSHSGTHSLRKKGTSSKTHIRSRSWDPRQGRSSPMLLRNRVDLDALVADPGLAIVFILDFLVGLQTTKPNPPSQSVAVCWGTWSPFAQKAQLPASVRVPMLGGPATNPDQVLCFKSLFRFNPGDPQNRNPIPLPTAMINFEFCLKSQAEQELLKSTLVVPQPASIGQQPQPAPRKQKAPPSAPPLPTEPPPITSESPDEDEPMEPVQGKPSVPQPPSRKGRPPLTQQTYEQPVTVQPALPLPQPPVVPGGGYQWGVQPMRYPITQVQPAMAQFGHMTEIATGPAQVPVFAIQQQTIGMAGISRKAFAVLARSHFPQIRDRHGDSPVLVDVGDARTVAPKLEQEMADPLGCNEIIFQFMAIASPSSNQIPDLPTNVFFTFNFYRFPQVNTERLLVGMPANMPEYVPGSPMILKRIHRTGCPISGDPGYQVKFTVDPEYLKPGEQKVFLQYMMRNCLHIDVWDADSLMLLGSCLLPLRHLCRKSQEAVQSYCQLPLVTTEMKTVDLGRGDGLSAVVRALLYAKVANVGYPYMGSSTLEKLGRLSHNPAVISHSLSKGEGANQRKIRGQPMRIGQSRSQFAIGKRLDDVTNKETSEEKQRKLARLENIRQIEKSFNSPSMHHSVVDDFTRDLQTFRAVRQENKHKALMSALLQSITTVHTIFPSLGSTEFMEFLLENPTTEAIAVYAEYSDPDLSVITDPREWQFFKRMHSLKTPLDESIFTHGSGGTTGEMKKDQIQLFLKPRESLYIPLKYQTFHNIIQPFGHQTQNNGATTGQSRTRTVMMESKTINISFKQVDTDQLISVLVLQVEPQPPVIHQTFRFYHPENSFLVKYLRLNPMPGGRAFHSVVCTDPNVICELNAEAAQGPQDVFLKATCGSSPQVKSFSLMLFGDPYQAFPLQNWEVHIHAAQKIDINTVQGHTSNFSLVLKPGAASRMIRCFSTAPNELSCLPAEAFLLQPGGLMELQASFKPLATGERTLQMTAVDVEMEELVYSWLVCASVRSPNITKAYQVKIPVSIDQIINKVSYTNQYSVERTFFLATNREDLITFKEKSISLSGHAEGTIGMRFYPREQPTAAEILIFVNDEDGNNQDTVAIKVIYTSM